MATKFINCIKPTPMVYGAEGRRLIEQASRMPEPHSPEVKERMLRNYEMIKKNNEIWTSRHHS